MGLFSKFKDYNGELDDVLEGKTFSSNVKTLLLSMVYKLETSYRDFYTVKRCVRKREDFLNELIETVRLYCDNIQIVDPDSSEAKALLKHKTIALTNEEERSILSYSTEIALLYAISDISPKYFYINENFALKDMLQNTLVNGYNINNVEILKDFNGWSWDVQYDKGFDYIDNIIYQNLLMILGEKFLYEWRTYGSTRRSFLEEAKNVLDKDRYLVFRHQLNGDIDREQREERYYRYMVSHFVNNNRKFYNKLVKKKFAQKESCRKTDNTSQDSEEKILDYKECLV